MSKNIHGDSDGFTTPVYYYKPEFSPVPRTPYKRGKQYKMAIKPHVAFGQSKSKTFARIGNLMRELDRLGIPQIITPPLTGRNANKDAAKSLSKFLKKAK